MEVGTLGGGRGWAALLGRQVLGARRGRRRVRVRVRVQVHVVSAVLGMVAAVAHRHLPAAGSARGVGGGHAAGWEPPGAVVAVTHVCAAGGGGRGPAAHCVVVGPGDKGERGCNVKARFGGRPLCPLLSPPNKLTTSEFAAVCAYVLCVLCKG